MINSMNTRFKYYRCFLVAGLLTFVVNGTAIGQSDSLKVPGNLFPTTKITTTGAVSGVGGDVIYKSPTPNVTNTVQGRLPGLFVTQGNGAPYQDGAALMIRGLGTYSSGGYKIFVDGFEVTDSYLRYLSPAEIASFSVLKDAAALSTFGMKGANGIVWIETKKGEPGKPTVDIQLRSGVQNAINVHKPLNATEFESLYNQAISNDNGRVWTPYYTPGTRNIDTDWYKEVMKKNGRFSEADLSFHGGSEDTRYNVVLGYADQQGLLNTSNTDQTSNDRFTKLNARANVDLKLFKILTANFNLGVRLEDWNRPNYSVSNLMNDLARYPQNIYNVYDDMTSDTPTNYSGTLLHPNNPVGSINGLGRQNQRLRILQGNFKFTEDLGFLLDGLYLQQSLSFYVESFSGYSKTKNYARYYNGSTTTTDQTTSIVASPLSAYAMEEWKQGAFTAGYDNTFGAHKISSALNLHISDRKGDGILGYMYHSLNFNGKANYSYDDRYVGEFGFSYYGSDAFAPGNRFGFYPAVSGAWIASNENFLKNSGVVDFLKVRASVGMTGGDENYVLDSGRYLYKQYYGSSPYGSPMFGSSAPFAGQGTLAALFLANPDVFAERSMKYNVGVDLNLFKKIDVNVDLFLDKRSGILTYDNSIMSYYGVNYQYNNIGKMTNKGFEMSAAYSDRVGDLNWSVFGTATYARNTRDYFAEVPTGEPYSVLTGKRYGVLMGLESTGFFQTEDFDAAGNLLEGIPRHMFVAEVQPGDLRYKDQNSDGFVDQLDAVEIGAPYYPSLSYGFGGNVAWRGFDLSIFITGASGGSVNMVDYSQSVAFVDNSNAYQWTKGAWAYYPQQGIDNRLNATYPRLTTVSNPNNYRNSSFWIRSNDFLRIKNVELGYDFFHRHAEGAPISKLRLYVNALNPVTFSKLLQDFNMDPESGYGYPALKSYNVGIQMTF